MDWERDGDVSSTPSLVVPSILNGERSVLVGDVIERSDHGFGRADADEGKGTVTGGVALEGIAVITGETACPVVTIGGPDGRLEG